MGLLDEAIREHLDLKRRRGADPADVERAEREALGPVRRAPTAQNVEVADQQQAEAGFAYDHEEELGWSGDPLDAPAPRSGSAARDRDHGPDLEDESFSEPQQRPSRLARIFGRADPEPEPQPEPEPEFEDPDFEDPVIRPPAARTPRSIEPTPSPRSSDASWADDAGESVPTSRPDEPLDPLEEPESSRSVPPPHPAGGLSEETTEYEVAPAHHPEPAQHPEPSDHPEPSADGEDVLEETPEFLQDTPDHDRLWFEQRPPKDFDFDG